jgi:hypothetical protein
MEIAAPTLRPQMWRYISDYIDASTSASEASIRALLIRLRMTSRTPADENSRPLPPVYQQSRRQQLPLHYASVITTLPGVPKTKRKKREASSRRAQSCTACRRRHRRCDASGNDNNPCAACLKKNIQCTFTH